ncbi:MAG: heme-copper oxidase subunit III [Gemmatimonadota bacterium]
MSGIGGDGEALPRSTAGGAQGDGISAGAVVALGHAPPAPGPYPIGLAAILATVGMLFAAFTAALLVRRTGADWVPVRLPGIVWLNTALLVASSAAVQRARGVMRRGASGPAVRWLAAGSVLGLLFLAGQLVAWRMLAARGVFLPTNPHAAFFYTLSAVHGAHVLGGLGALGWTLRRAAGGAYTAARHIGLSHAAIFWHFVGGVWVYLLTLLSTL